MNLKTKALGLGYKHAADVLGSGRAIPYSLEACFRDYDLEKARLLADPDKIDKAFRMVIEGAEHRIQTEDKRNWYYWAKPRGVRSSPDIGAEKAFKEFYKGEPLTKEEKVVVLGSLSIKIEEELNALKKERDTIRI
ncbi:hypothetical protein KJ966_11285 [bacterium]|nr:hypothetical protein [bacterium]